jgi:simple sugar transport system ATP-binding protein
MGIGMVHQHFQLVPSLTVAENVALGYEMRQGGVFVDRQKTAARVRQLSDEYGLRVSPTERVGDLSVGEQQRVEILKLLYREAELLILDEPSAVLTPKEVEDLFDVLRRLAAAGRTIIFITHKLNEVMALCQRATVLRNGEVVGEVEVASTQPEELAHLMVGHTVERVQAEGTAEVAGEAKLVLRDLSATDDQQLPALSGVNLTVHAGEIVGVAGVEGNGQSELIQVIAGLRNPTQGDVVIAGQRVNDLSGRERRLRGLSLIPEDRNQQGLSKDMSIWENVVATRYNTPTFTGRGGIMHIGSVKAFAQDLIGKFDVRTTDSNAKVSSLSGGNAQKVVIARETAEQPEVFIAAQPTRGLDVGAAQFVHERILEIRDAGAWVLLISADLDELLTLSDRIAVMYEGRIAGWMSRAEATREKLGVLMTGSTL